MTTRKFRIVRWLVPLAAVAAFGLGACDHADHVTPPPQAEHGLRPVARRHGDLGPAPGDQHDVAAPLAGEEDGLARPVATRAAGVEQSRTIRRSEPVEERARTPGAHHPRECAT